MYQWTVPAAATARRERRLLPREPQFGLSFDLFFERPRRVMRRRRAVRATVDVLDLTLEGALLRADGDVRLGVGAQIVLAAGEGMAQAEVRRCFPTGDGSAWRFYGVRFTSADLRFQETVSERLSDDRRKLHDQRMNC